MHKNCALPLSLDGRRSEQLRYEASKTVVTPLLWRGVFFDTRQRVAEKQGKGENTSAY